jgi:YebC/PmpR family DNA-binding regulatory protein
MSGHSKWSTIKRKKGAADAKRGAIFTRMAKEVALAAREGGGDPETNFKLRLAVDKAKSVNMPKENIERAIRRGTGEDKDGIVMEEVFYEGYGPHGVALMIECVTENRNRAVADIRHILNRFGGSMGESGSVAWQFNRAAYFGFDSGGRSEDAIFELAVEGGADDVTFDDGYVEIIGPVDAFKTISDQLRAAKIEADEAELRMMPKQEMELEVEDTLKVMRVIDALDELDDVMNVYSNLSLSDEALASLEED